MTHTDHDVHTLAGAYALHALSDLERAAFDRHLTGCAACRSEVTELQQTAARLADPVATTPPARLRTRVLAQAAHTPQVGPGRTTRPAARPWRRRLLTAAAALILTATALGTGLAIGQRQTDRARTAATAASHQAQQLTDLLTAPDAHVTTITMPTGGQVTVVTSPTRDQGAALLTRMPTPGPDHAYQLWLIKGATPDPAGILPPGATTATIWFTRVRGADAFGISREHPGGAITPTIPLVISFPLT